jgi:CBS domain containing-hemolysin-like protein
MENVLDLEQKSARSCIVPRNRIVYLNRREPMVGAIEDEFDTEEPPVLDKGGGRFEVRAACPIDDFAEKCGIDVPKMIGVDSVGGIFVKLLGHVPRVGEEVKLGSARLRVLESEPTHVVRVLVEKPPPVETPEDPG